jgi:hypothetical protein
MPIKPETLTAYLDLNLEEFENEDALKAHFDQHFLRRDLAHTDKDVQGKVFGKVNGVLRNKLKGFGKAVGITDLEFDTLDPTDAIEAMQGKLTDTVTSLRSELDGAKKGGSGKTTQEVEELTKRLNDAIKERDAFGAQAKDYETKYTTLEGSIKQREAQAKIDAAFSRAMEAIPFREDVNPYARKGFEAEMRSKYKVEFSDDGAAKVIGADGNIVMNKHKAQVYATLDELAKAHAEEAKMIGGAPQGGTPVRKTVSTTSTTPATPANPQAPAERRTGPPVMPR